MNRNGLAREIYPRQEGRSAGLPVIALYYQLGSVPQLRHVTHRARVLVAKPQAPARDATAETTQLTTTAHRHAVMALFSAGLPPRMLAVDPSVAFPLL